MTVTIKMMLLASIVVLVHRNKVVVLPFRFNSNILLIQFMYLVYIVLDDFIHFSFENNDCSIYRVQNNCYFNYNNELDFKTRYI
jgi:hypothetical protein